MEATDTVLRSALMATTATHPTPAPPTVTMARPGSPAASSSEQGPGTDGAEATATVATIAAATTAAATTAVPATVMDAQCPTVAEPIAAAMLAEPIVAATRAEQPAVAMLAEQPVADSLAAASLMQAVAAAVSTAVAEDTAAADTAKVFRTETRQENGGEVFTPRSHFPFGSFYRRNRCQSVLSRSIPGNTTIPTGSRPVSSPHR